MMRVPLYMEMIDTIAACRSTVRLCGGVCGKICEAPHMHFWRRCTATDFEEQPLPMNLRKTKCKLQGFVTVRGTEMFAEQHFDSICAAKWFKLIE